MNQNNKKSFIINGVTVDRNIEIPKLKRKTKNKQILECMSIGDSIKVKRQSQSLRVSAIRLGLKVTVRLMPNGEYRMFRIA
jgi:hypothetical protein